jgi:hypothetical protein
MNDPGRNEGTLAGVPSSSSKRQASPANRRACLIVPEARPAVESWVAMPYRPLGGVS